MIDAVVVGQVARDLVLLVDEVPPDLSPDRLRDYLGHLDHAS